VEGRSRQTGSFGGSRLPLCGGRRFSRPAVPFRPGAASSTHDASDQRPGSEGSREERGSGAPVASLTCTSVLDHASFGPRI
jgi:hypothetical protein